MDEHEHLRHVRAELSRIIEPGDLLAGVVVEHLGCFEAHTLIRSEAAPPARLIQSVAEAAEAQGLSSRQRDLREALLRWRTRISQADGVRDLTALRRLGGGILVPEDSRWPQQLRDLGPAGPVALWWRGESSSPALPLFPAFHRMAAIVGSREITDYGGRITAELSETLTGRGFCILSGGAYGVDAAAHRAALRVWARGTEGEEQPEEPLIPTIAVLAGGLDRFYPAGNESLLRGIAEAGLLLSELPPGASPTKHRFLQRNRIIAALASATVVAEARWRSGAQNTAHHALTLGRPVGAVPGSVHSAASAGCHRLLRETPAELVRDAADLAGMIAGTLPMAQEERNHRSERITAQEKLPLSGTEASHPESSARPEDSLSEADRLLLDALPKRRLSTPGKLSEVAGLPMPQVLGGLSRLERKGLARTVNGHWGKSLARPKG